MGIKDCPECWDTPCTCGYEYNHWGYTELLWQMWIIVKAIIIKLFTHKRRTK